MILMYPKKIGGNLISLSNFDRKVDNTSKGIILFLVFLIFINILTLGVISLDIWMWLPVVGTDNYKYYFIKRIHYYQVTILMFIWFWLAIEIRSRFKLLNNMLRKSLRLSRNFKIFRVYDERIFRKLDVGKELKEISQPYNSLCDVVDEVNSFFGNVLLFFVMLAISLAVNFVVMNMHAPIIEDTLQRNFFILKLRFVGGMWLTDNLVKISALAAAGEFLAREARNTITICFAIINVTEPTEYYDFDVLKKDLRILAQQVAHRNIHLSAGGFFVANFTIMGFVVGSMTTYIIVAIQFLKGTGAL
ncbi:hypothetical protein JTB14_036853 [Gonioctena quinquepunctata]|nr:hypothetical protein JTB14_036853 [Gonioctena quinquepunctata]